MANNPRPINRKDITTFSPNQRVLRAIEEIFNLLPSAVDALEIRVTQNELDIAANTAAIALLKFDVVVITANYTTDGNEIIICNNTSPITVTMNTSPVDGDRSYIKRINSSVNVTSTKGIDGAVTRTINKKYDSPLITYNESTDEYLVI